MREAIIGYLRGSEAQRLKRPSSSAPEKTSSQPWTQSRNQRNQAITQSRNHAISAIGAITQSCNQRNQRNHAITQSAHAILIGSRELMLLLALHVKVEGGHRTNLNTHVRRLHVHLDKLDLAVILLRELSTEVGTARSTGMSVNVNTHSTRRLLSTARGASCSAPPCTWVRS